MVLAEVVILLLIFPGEIVSITRTGCANRARRYAERSADEMRKPLNLTVNY